MVERSQKGRMAESESPLLRRCRDLAPLFGFGALVACGIAFGVGQTRESAHRRPQAALQQEAVDSLLALVDDTPDDPREAAPVDVATLLALPVKVAPEPTAAPTPLQFVWIGPGEATLDPRDRPVATIVPTAVVAAAAGEGALRSATPVPTRPPVRTARPSLFASYVVAPGDSLTALAARYGTTAAAIRTLNDLGADGMIRAGQSLRVPTVAGPVHVVRPGETLYSIARGYGVEPGQVAAANGLPADFKVLVGQRLVVPGGVEPRAVAAPASDAPAGALAASTTNGQPQAQARSTPTPTPIPTPKSTPKPNPTPKSKPTPTS